MFSKFSTQFITPPNMKNLVSGFRNVTPTNKESNPVRMLDLNQQNFVLARKLFMNCMTLTLRKGKVSKRQLKRKWRLTQIKLPKRAKTEETSHLKRIWQGGTWKKLMPQHFFCIVVGTQTTMRAKELYAWANAKIDCPDIHFLNALSIFDYKTLYDLTIDPSGTIKYHQEPHQFQIKEHFNATKSAFAVLCTTKTGATQNFCSLSS